VPTANLTNEGWPARAQTQRGAQGSNEVGGIAAGTLVSPFSFIPPQVSPLKDPGRRPGGATQRLLGPGLGSCVEDLSSTPERLIKNDGGSRVVHDACMAMGTRDGEQEELFVTHQQLRTEGHPYYVGVNKVLAEHGFDRRDASNPPAASREHREATAGPHCRFQPWTSHAQTLWRR